MVLHNVVSLFLSLYQHFHIRLAVSIRYLIWERIHLQCRKPWFISWVGKIPWRRERLPTPVFRPGGSHGLYSPRGRKELDMTGRLSLSSTFVCLHAQSCPTLCDPMDHGVLCPWDSPGKNIGVGCCFLLQGIPLTQGSNPRDQISCVSCTGRLILYHWATWEAPGSTCWLASVNNTEIC